MSLTSSMWSSVSGLLAHGERMSVVGNNISNVNTIAFKGQRMDFQDFVYQNIGTASGPSQVGYGTSIGSIMNDYKQGSFEASTRSTDIAIQGNGFFMVKPPNNNQSFYTRAGNFDFNKEGFLVDPHGYVLQGWNISRETSYGAGGTQRNNSGIVGSGSPVDIKLDAFTCPPRHTTNVTLPINLPNAKSASSHDLSSDPEDPFFSLLKKWNATQDPALGENSYTAQSTLTVYDEGGKQHKLTIYFDRVANNNPAPIDGYTDSESYWEYIITMDPSEDMRDFSATFDPNIPPATSPDVPDKLKGLLGAGTLTFSSSGLLKDMTAFVPHTNGSDTDHWWTTGAMGDVAVDLSKWVAAPFDSNGYPMFAPNFSGTAGMSQAYKDGIWSQPNADAAGRMISLDLGLRSKTNAWQFMGDPVGNTPGTDKNSGLVTAAGLRQQSVAQARQNGKYMWEGVRDGNTGEAYTILTKGDSIPPVFGSTWGVASPSSNGTNFTWDVTLAGATAGNVSVVTSKDFDPTTGVTIKAAGIPDDATERLWTGVGLPNVTASIHRDGAGDLILSPTEFEKNFDLSTWTVTTAGGMDTYTAPDGHSTITCPAGTPIEQLRNLSWDNPTPVNATEHYWDMCIPNGKPSSVTLTSTTPAAPTFTSPAVQTDNDVTEYYWYNEANPDITLVSYTVPLPPPPGGPGTTPVWTPYTGTHWPNDATPKLTATNNGNKYFLNGMDGASELERTASTCQGDNFYEINGHKQDGYASGSLSNVFVGTDGVLSASYSNGVSLQLYQIVLYDFPSTQNLRREGGNLYSETRESGAPSSGAPGTGPFGTTQGNFVEQSNVDLAREFVNMITTQRGFQANSKNITTVDAMLETVIGMKR